MGVVAALAVTAYLLGWQAGPVLARAGWPSRRPGVAIALWAGLLAALLGLLIALVLLAIAWPPGPLHAWVEHLRACVPGHTHSGETASLAVALLAGALLLRAAHRGLSRARHTTAERRQHHEMVRLVAKDPAAPADVCLVAYPIPLVYCLPRKARPIVMTTGALRRLDATPLLAVLEHERAHLRQRHHLLLSLADAVRVALPWSPTAREAVAVLPRLMEMAADDDAAGRCGSAAVVQALRELDLLPAPETAPGDGFAVSGDSRRRRKERIARLESGGPLRGVALRVEAALLAAPLCGLAVAVLGTLLSC